MPIIKSAIKRAKQALVRRSHNLQVKRAVKQDVQALHTAIAQGKAGDIQASLSAAYSEIDRAVKKGAFHKNTAARRKSQLATLVAKATGASTAEEPKTTKGAGKAATKTVTKKAAAKKPAATATKTAAKAAPKTTKAPAAKPAAKKAPDTKA
jgi:small subunit ribosomal protein S20